MTDKSISVTYHSIALTHGKIHYILIVNCMEDRIAEFEKICGHRFADSGVLIEALTHPSFANENMGCPHYQRLEFLGDRVLGLIISEALYREFPSDDESALSIKYTSLVCKKALLRVARNLSVERFVRVSPQSDDLRNGLGTSSVLSDVLEAVIAAIYLDAGLEKVAIFVEKAWEGEIRGLISAEKDPKNSLQEWSQREVCSLPSYRTECLSIVDGTSQFFAEVSVGGGLYTGSGTGSSKRSAQREAARECLQRIAYGSSWKEKTG